jgi:hypothetical protein
VQIFNDVIALREEVQGLRQRFVSLKDAVLLRKRIDVDSEMEFSYHAPALSAAIGQGKFSTAIKDFQEQNESNYEEMSNLKFQFAAPAMVSLSVEVQRCREELAAMRKSVASSDTLLKSLRSRIEFTRLEYPESRLAEQEYQLQGLLAQIEDEKQVHLHLKRELDSLEK